MSLPYKRVPLGVINFQAPTGKVPSDQLSLVLGVGTFQLQAARAMRALQAEARKAGIVAASSGDYRSYTEQVSLFKSRYEPGWKAGADNRFWPRAIYGGNDGWWHRVRGAAAAVPGKSNHGLGIANDMAQRTPEGHLVTLSTRVAGAAMSYWDWLNANGRRFGWSWGEAVSEPWHWVYIEGDVIPDAVLAFEGKLPPPIPYNPALRQWGLFPLNKAKPALVFGTGYTPGTQNLQSTVQYFHDVARVEAGQLPAEPQTVFLEQSVYIVRNYNAFFNRDGSNVALAREAFTGFCGAETWKITDFLATRKR